MARKLQPSQRTSVGRRERRYPPPNGRRRSKGTEPVPNGSTRANHRSGRTSVHTGSGSQAIAAGLGDNLRALANTAKVVAYALLIAAAVGACSKQPQQPAPAATSPTTPAPSASLASASA